MYFFLKDLGGDLFFKTNQKTETNLIVLCHVWYFYVIFAVILSVLGKN